jgi:hypothetical protein
MNIKIVIGTTVMHLSNKKISIPPDSDSIYSIVRYVNADRYIFYFDRLYI